MNAWMDGIMQWYENAEKTGTLMYCRVDRAMLDRQAHALVSGEFALPEWRDPEVYPRLECDFIEHVFWVNVINAHFTHPYPPYHKYEIYGQSGRSYRGSYALEARFTELLEHSHGEYAEAIARVIRSLHQTKRFFHRNRIHTLPLIRERRSMLAEAHAVLKEKFGGRALHLFEEAGWDAMKLVRLLTVNFPRGFGSDAVIDPETRVALYFAKRAQLMPLVYQGRAASSHGALRELSSMEHIGAICDYAVPVGLVNCGCLVYSEACDQMIRNYVYIPKGSRCEIEIRAATAVAMVELVRMVNVILQSRGRPHVHMGHLDYAMWTNGRAAKIPHHLTQTLAY